MVTRRTWRSGIALLASSLVLACSGRLDVGSNVIWSAEYESGDLREWVDAGGTAVGEATGSVEVTSERAHAGRYALKLTHLASPGAELNLPVDAEREQYYSAWFLLPEDAPVVQSWTIFKFASHDLSDPNTVRTNIELQLRSLPGGGYVVNALSREEDQLRAPVADPPPWVTPGVWFHLEVRYRPDSGENGRFRAWLDDRLVYDMDQRKTRAGDDLLFGITNLADIEATFPLYVDTTAISASRVTPTGTLK